MLLGDDGDDDGRGLDGLGAYLGAFPAGFGLGIGWHGRKRTRTRRVRARTSGWVLSLW